MIDIQHIKSVAPLAVAHLVFVTTVTVAVAANPSPVAWAACVPLALSTLATSAVVLSGGGGESR